MTNKQAQITINAIKFMLDNAQYSEDVEEALNMAIETLSRSETPNGWIPCSERLPELDDEVLVTDDSGELRHCIFCTWDETWCGFITYEEGMRIKATAWMPLPPAYKGGE